MGNKVSEKITTIQVDEMAATIGAVEHIISKDYSPKSIYLNYAICDRDKL